MESWVLRFAFLSMGIRLEAGEEGEVRFKRHLNNKSMRWDKYHPPAPVHVTGKACSIHSEARSLKNLFLGFLLALSAGLHVYATLATLL